MDTLERIEAALKSRGWTWTEWALRASVHQPSVSGLKQRRRRVSPETARRLAEALGNEITAGEIVMLEPTRKDEPTCGVCGHTRKLKRRHRH